MLAVMHRIPLFLLTILLTSLWSGTTLMNAAELGKAVDAVLAKVPRGGKAAVAVVDLDQRQWVLKRNADQSLSLASTTKLITSAAALVGLGTDFVFHTRLVGLGPLGADGTLPGLGVIGGGSPCFDEHFAEGRDPDAVFRGFAAEMKRRGVRRIAGDLVIDSRLFSGPIRPDTWPADQTNLQRWFSAPCTVETRPRSTRIRIVNNTRSLASGAGKNAISRALDSNTVIASGTCGRATAWFPLAIASDPELLIGDHLKAICADSGIPISGSVRLGAVDPTAGPLLIDLKQPLIPAINITNQHSHNFYAEQLLRLLGVKRSQEGSIVAGRTAALAILQERFGMGMGPVTLLDGSGLSYGNEASAAYLVNLLDAMHRSDLGPTYRASLKERNAPGISAKVKTGTHNEARALAGYFDGASKRHYAFAILLNRGDSTSFGWADKMREDLFQALAAAP